MCSVLQRIVISHCASEDKTRTYDKPYNIFLVGGYICMKYGLVFVKFLQNRNTRAISYAFKCKAKFLCFAHVSYSVTFSPFGFIDSYLTE